MATTRAEPKQRFTLMLPAELKRRLERQVPKRERSAFVAEAVEKALGEQAREELLAIIRNREFLGERRDGPDSLEVLRQVRDEMSGL